MDQKINAKNSSIEELEQLVAAAEAKLEAKKQALAQSFGRQAYAYADAYGPYALAA